jgi:hypothetical protein
MKRLLAGTVAAILMAGCGIVDHRESGYPEDFKHCYPVVIADPGKYPAAVEKACQDWNIRQGAEYVKKHPEIDG